MREGTFTLKANKIVTDSKTTSAHTSKNDYSVESKAKVLITGGPLIKQKASKIELN